MPTSIDLSIILPCFNEGHRLPHSIALIQEKLKTLNIITEIIIVDDGSVDTTALIAKQLGLILISYSPNHGKGYAINCGMKIAQGTYCLFMDADLATHLDAIEQFFRTIRSENVDLLIGNRTLIDQYKSQPFLRRCLGQCFIGLTTLFLGYQHTDINCGFKMFKRVSCAIIFKQQRIHGWAFDAELLFIAHQHHLYIKELPVIWKHQSQSKVRLWRDITSSLWGLITIRINNARGLYR